MDKIRTEMEPIMGNTRPVTMRKCTDCTSSLIQAFFEPTAIVLQSGEPIESPSSSMDYRSAHVLTTQLAKILHEAETLDETLKKNYQLDAKVEKDV